MLISNYWLILSKVRRIHADLKDYLGKPYAEFTYDITSFLANHPDWQENFSLNCILCDDNIIDKFIIKETY